MAQLQAASTFWVICAIIEKELVSIDRNKKTSSVTLPVLCSRSIVTNFALPHLRSYPSGGSSRADYKHTLNRNE